MPLPDFEIMFDDLKEEKQKDFLKWARIESAADENLDIMPLAVIPFYEGDDN